MEEYKKMQKCPKCGENLYIINSDNNKVYPCLCKCQVEVREQKRLEELQRQQALKIEEYKLTCLLGRRYKNVSFENSDIDDDNKAIYEKIKQYAENYKQVYENGYGLYIYGKNGTGKTHLLACLCNYLIEHLQTCAFTNFLNIAEDIRKAYNGDQLEECTIAKYSKVKFLFIDDFGKESYKKLKSNTDNLWLEEKIFEILNNRYNNMLPTIFSSNYSLKEMAQNFGFDKAIIDRIYELSTQIIEMKGRNRRYGEV